MPTRDQLDSARTTEYGLHVPFGQEAQRRKLAGLQEIGIEVSDSVFENPAVGDEITVKIVSLTITQEIRE